MEDYHDNDHQSMTHHTSGECHHHNPNDNYSTYHHHHHDYKPPIEFQRPIQYLRFAVLIVWLAAACCVSYGVYWHTRNTDYKEFELEYKVNAMKILDSFYATLDIRLGAINTLATAITSYAKYKTHDTYLSVSKSNNSPLWADAALYGLLRDNIITGLIAANDLEKSYPELWNMYSAFGEIPSVKAWVDSKKA